MTQSVFSPLRRRQLESLGLDRRRSVLRTASRTLAGRIGLAMGAAVVLVIVIGSLTGVDPNAVSVGEKFQPPGPDHLLGTDHYGRDQFARVAAGGRSSLAAAFLVLLIAMSVALVVGVTAGLLSGPVDTVLMRFNDVLISIPSLVLAMAVIGALGPGFLQLVGALSLGYVASFTRMARSFALSCRERADVAAGRLAGVSWPRTIIGHVLPGVIRQLSVVATLMLGDIVISIAGLSFLGLGIQPPVAEWGSMLSESRSAFTIAPWLLLAPALAIILTTTSVNLLADAFRDAEAGEGR